MSEPQAPGIIVVPHTHWDREWYEPHDVFRLRLVHMLDELFGLLQAEPEYKFTLDGQAAAIEDYLEMRPEMEGLVRSLVESGRLAVGPFLILLDEFACDGETIIRNLELGIASSKRLGREMKLGYLPDMFGHAAQMPQLLSGFGIYDAALWRGVPDRVRSSAFNWVAPNGASVRTQYLFDGYGNGLDLFAIEGQLPELSSKYLEDTATWYDGDDVLAMLGSDHTAPLPDLVDRLDQARVAGGAPHLSIETVEGYVRRQAGAREVPSVTGELRSHARGNLLPGVFSIRTNMKQSMSDAERAATVAERLDALFPSGDNQSFLDTAWYRIVESTAHDSVTGCGVDETAEQVQTRLHTASYIAKAVGDHALQAAVKDVSADDHLVVNPSGYARKGQVEITVAGEERLPVSWQVIDRYPTTLGDEEMRTDELVKILRRIHGRELFGQLINNYEWGPHGLDFSVAEVPVGEFDLARFTAELEERVSNSPSEATWKVRTEASPRRKVLVPVEVGGLSAALVDPETTVEDPVTVTETTLENRALKISVNPDGTVDITGYDTEVLGALKLVDEGDRGDSYNYGPVALAEAIDAPASVSTHVLEKGPLRGKIRIDRTYELPAELSSRNPDKRSEETVEQLVETTVELRAEEDFLRVTVEFTNQAADHRLRILLPVGEKAVPVSYSAGQYGVTKRGRTAEGGWGEFPLPTFPATHFAAAGKVTALVDKLTEYELVSEKDEDALALTLVRAVGMMSVNVHPLRDEPAGSEFPVPAAQYLGEKVVTKLGILPTPNGWEQSEVTRTMDIFRFDPVVARGSGPRGTESAVPVPAVSLETNGKVPLTSLRVLREGGEVQSWESRFVNYLPSSTKLDVQSAEEWWPTDLAGGVAADRPALSPSSNPVIPRAEIWTFRYADN